jgi:uncharacterized protein
MNNPGLVKRRENKALPAQLQVKVERVKEILADLERVVVAFSGGVDSTLVAQLAVDVLGRDSVLAAIAISASLGQDEERDALRMLNEIGISHVQIATKEVEDARYAANPINRCYFCKEHVYAALIDVARQNGFETVVDGFNAEDTSDFRPGRKAGRELGVRSPLYEVGLTKDEIRALARHFGLSNWDKPQMACLSSRVEYGITITPKILSQVDRAEMALRGLGFADLRVRHHDKLARVEVEQQMIPRALAQRDEIVAAVRAAGYTHVTIDLEGLRHGSMNEGFVKHG